MPYYLRHGIEIFSDYLFRLDVTVLIWNLNRIMQSTVKLTLKVLHLNMKHAATVKCFFYHKMGE